MKHSEIREAYAQHSTFLIGVRFAEFPGLRASRFIRATINTEIPSLDGYGEWIGNVSNCSG
ncbi:hypothetical protein [Legionella bononiensis]|uniref:Uncharacterized protein n=1 Tax=Legionella bononiensis TaxID=2793102 RepID=A0ABS1W797_9GAMM|nr:hypothetical protein [Legionella bononiensis]MBL7481296.1 hypothetical protein [Legionella bononiensis]MBL7525200.1 hypothetical protein [Legionella bononiensis]MBL7561383.1 hypothetical protein [Legionella bononiensis]